MKTTGIGTIMCLAAVAMMLVGPSAFAYPTYSGTPCANCHQPFNDGSALHDLHLSVLSDTNCQLCHPTLPGSTPVGTQTAADPTSFSCAGCHGRDYGGSVDAVGLRVFHVTQRGQSCSPCHNSDPASLSENVNPPHYSRPKDVSLTDACMDNLDNDGDGQVDGNDPDCQVPVETTTWGRIKALYQ